MNLVKNILADGKIDAEEVKELREAIFADGKIDREEADALFELNDKASEKCPEFKDLFVEALKSHILEDGVIDDEEIDYLKEKISADVDENEKALLEALSAEVELPEELADLLD